MKQINLSLTIDETNKILEALSQLPFVQVHQLIAKIHEDASEQFNRNDNAGESEEKIKALAHG